MSRKPVTLWGVMMETIAKVADKTSDTNPLTTAADVRELIKETVTPTFLTSLNAEAKEPQQFDTKGTKYVCLGGTKVTIQDRADGEEGADIVWDGGSMSITPEYAVFAGAHNDESVQNTDVTMVGGTIKHLFMGGLHKSHVCYANLVMTGGTVNGSIMGGGSAQYVSDEDIQVPTSVDEATNVVEESSIHISGGKVKMTVWAGPESIALVGKSTVLIDEKANIGCICGCGSNGRTAESNVTIDNVKLIQLMGVCRGTNGVVNITINGGKIETAFVGGYLPFEGSKDKPNANDCSGTVEKATMTINPGAEVTDVALGGNDYAEVTKNGDVLTLIDNR